jgi:hypothetical protein
MHPNTHAIGYDPEFVPPDDPIRESWETFCNVIDRLLAEGHEGRYAFIKGSEIVGIWDNMRELVDATRHIRDTNRTPTLVQRVLKELPKEMALHRTSNLWPIKLTK